MNNIVTNKWNPLDTIIYKAETIMKWLKEELKASREETPDPEVMIQAATQELQKENEQLKRKSYPGRIIVEGDNYYCPDCHEPLSSELIKKKFCPECGKRIVLQKNLYATSHKQKGHYE